MNRYLSSAAAGIVGAFFGAVFAVHGEAVLKDEILDLGFRGWSLLLGGGAFLVYLSSTFPEQSSIGKILWVTAWPILAMSVGAATWVYRVQRLPAELDPGMLAWTAALATAGLLGAMAGILRPKTAFQKSFAGAAGTMFGMVIGLGLAMVFFKPETITVRELAVALVAGGSSGLLLGLLRPEGL